MADARRGGSNPPFRTIQTYLDELRAVRRESTYYRAKQILNEFLSSDPQGASRADLVSYLQWLRDRGNSKHTQANKLIRLQAWLRWNGTPVQCPTPRFTLPSVTIYSESELSELFAACGACEASFYRLLLHSGLRMQEAKFLEWSDIRDGCIHVRAKSRYGFEPKSHEERSIPIPQFTFLPGAGSLVFGTRSGKPDRHLLRNLKRLVVRHGIGGDWTLHKFRRTAITGWLRAGLDLRTVMTLAGHSDIESTMRYLRPLEGDALRKRMEQAWVNRS